jgi:hypothetical protein
MSTIEVELIGDLGKSFRILRGNHRFKKLPFAMPASEVAMASGHANRCKSVFLIWESIVMVRNSAWNGEGELVPKMSLPNPESFGLKFF